MEFLQQGKVLRFKLARAVLPSLSCEKFLRRTVDIRCGWNTGDVLRIFFFCDVLLKWSEARVVPPFKGHDCLHFPWNCQVHIVSTLHEDCTQGLVNLPYSSVFSALGYLTNQVNFTNILRSIRVCLSGTLIIPLSRLLTTCRTDMWMALTSSSHESVKTDTLKSVLFKAFLALQASTECYTHLGLRKYSTIISNCRIS